MLENSCKVETTSFLQKKLIFEPSNKKYRYGLLNQALRNAAMDIEMTITRMKKASVLIFKLCFNLWRLVEWVFCSCRLI